MDTQKLHFMKLLDQHADHYEVELTPEEAQNFFSSSNYLDENARGNLLVNFETLIARVTHARPFHVYRVGSAGTRLIKLCFVKNYFTFGDEIWEDLIENLLALASGMTHYAPDEVDLTLNTPDAFEIRLWWD